MFIFPIQWVTLETKADIRKTKADLKKIIQGNHGFLNSAFPRTGTHYLGKVGDDVFYLKRMSQNMKGYIVPHFFGTFRSNGSGTEIKIHIRPHLLFLFFFVLLMVGFSLLTWSTWESHVELGSERSFRNCFQMFCVSLAFYLTITGSFKFYSYRAISELKQSLNAEVIRNTY